MPGVATNSPSLPRITFPRRPSMSAKQKRFMWSFPLVGACAVFAGAASDWINRDGLASQLKSIPDRSTEMTSAMIATEPPALSELSFGSCCRASEPSLEANAIPAPQPVDDLASAYTWAPNRAEVERRPSDFPAVAMINPCALRW